ncbi:MAG: flagellar biosynthesis anti-sigma factor FlgM [Oscillospiraceae bacterium]|jgi:anti-sigma28 factor (negative regulator of flagellin synthesis)|nr:flagellar biosynthesis anti-sigma factor FlgM [Oscillospiraceae bacterium]
MKINPVAANAAVSAYRAGRVRRSATTDLTAAVDDVRLSDEGIAFAKVLADAKEKISEMSVSESSGRVSTLRDAINGGRYSVPPRDVAESIISALK